MLSCLDDRPNDIATTRKKHRASCYCERGTNKLSAITIYHSLSVRRRQMVNSTAAAAATTAAAATIAATVTAADAITAAAVISK